MPRQFSLDTTRNIGIMAHIDAGKTTTSERILFFSGKTRKLGEVHEGTAVMDFMEQEQERGITIVSAATTVTWHNHHTDTEYRINLIDTPGHVDFTAEVERSLRVLDGAVAVFCAKGGVEPQSETVWHQATKYNVPRIAFVNKMDINGADFDNCIKMMRERLKTNAMAIQLPMGSEETFCGVIDIIAKKAYYYTDEDKLGVTFEEKEIPQQYSAKVTQLRAELEEFVAGADDQLTDKFLSGQPLTVEDIKKGVRIATLNLSLTPVLCGSAYKNKGIQMLLDAVCDYLPSPLDKGGIVGFNAKNPEQEITLACGDEQPLCAIAFKIVADNFVGRLTYVRVYSGTLSAGSYVYNSSKKTRERISKVLQMHSNQRNEVPECYAGDIVAVVGLKDTATGDTLCTEAKPIALESMVFPEPVIKVAIEPKTKQGSERMVDALAKLSEEDPTFKFYTDKETNQMIIAGMGELHLEIIYVRLVREFKVEATIGKPQVTYRETVTTSANYDCRFVRQTGGKGQFAHAVVSIEPLPMGSGLVLENKSVGGAIPKEYAEAFFDGVRDAARGGVLAGYELVDFKLTLLDGSTHPVDSSALSFKVCGSLALREVASKAKPILLEPMMKTEITLPEEYLGDVMGNIVSRRGIITGTQIRNGIQVINCLCPLSEMFGYATVLRSRTQGRGNYTMQFDTFTPVPSAEAKRILGY